jgi:hypothetical protein
VRLIRESREAREAIRPEEGEVRHQRFLLGFVFVLVAHGSVWGQKITTDYDKHISFSGYKTYAWTEGTPAKNQLMHQRIADGIDKQLAAKGFQKIEASNSPDLLVRYQAAVGTEVRLKETTDSGVPIDRWADRPEETIPVGRLVVQIGDAKTKKLVWLGKASGALSEKPETMEQKINNALQRMFKKFPPAPPKT